MNFINGFLLVPYSLGQALVSPDTWELIAAALSVALPVLAKRLWTERRDKTRALIEKAANTAADVIIVLIEKDLIPDDEKAIVELWTSRVRKLLEYSGIKFDAKTEATARGIALARIGQAALIHEANNLGVKARELGKSLEGLSYEFTNGLTSKVKK